MAVPMRLGRTLLLVHFSLLLVGSCWGCFGVRSSIQAPGKLRLVRESYVSEFVLGFNPKTRSPEYTEHAFFQHLYDATPRKVIKITVDGEKTGRHSITVTPNHYVMNMAGKLVKAEDLEIGDGLLFVDVSSVKMVPAQITNLISTCDYVTNVFTMSEYIVVDNFVFSCFSSMSWLGVDIMEVKSIMFPQKMMYRFGLGTINTWLDYNLFSKLGFSVCGEPCVK
ncbi:hypothetical protein NDN08_008157 [Rhodosorus marinus]|uniref:Hedgehog protein Hint domain-containing protein n=1 Tax=Rhodosorus marinus TaxID=101924 RepID=A0AAV8UZL9_9RHOD|nr:hypothetical protein NDN08_008157 [Rhodosorus marinus]